MGRPATGSPKWNVTKGVWEARITLASGERKPIAMPGIPPCAASPSGSPSSCPCASCSQARRVAKLVSDKARDVRAVPAEVAETADEWYVRYHAYQVELGHSDAESKRHRWNKWIAPRIGHKPLADVTRDDVEDIRDALDVAIQAWHTKGRSRGALGSEIGGKTAMNVWSCLTSSLRAATSSKRRELRVLDGKPSPALGVEPPGDRDTRKARRKTFLFPSEATALLGAAAVPLEWRTIYALALYTYLRPGELRVLTWGDVDVQRAVVSVVKAWDYREQKEKEPKTRNGVREVPIAPPLLPLLELLQAGKAPSELVAPGLSTYSDGHLAELFRRHLVAAGLRRATLHVSSKTHVQANFRSCRDSGITWLAMTGLGVDKIMRRAGHDELGTTMGYVKLAEDLSGDLGEAFGPLPPALLEEVWGSGLVSAFRIENPSETREIQCTGRDLNPYASRRWNLNPLRLPISPPVPGVRHVCRDDGRDARALAATARRPTLLYGGLASRRRLHRLRGLGGGVLRRRLGRLDRFARRARMVAQELAREEHAEAALKATLPACPGHELSETFVRRRRRALLERCP